MSATSPFAMRHCQLLSTRSPYYKRANIENIKPGAIRLLEPPQPKPEPIVDRHLAADGHEVSASIAPNKVRFPLNKPPVFRRSVKTSLHHTIAIVIAWDREALRSSPSILTEKMRCPILIPPEPLV